MKLAYLSVLILSIILSNTYTFATNPQPTDWERLSPYNISFSIKADLNNDGRPEKVSILRQWDGEGWYSDDQWYIISILDEDYNILYESDVSYFQEVDSFSVKDIDADGFKEIIVSLCPTKYWSPKTYTYGWKGNGYEVIEDGEL